MIKRLKFADLSRVFSSVKRRREAIACALLVFAMVFATGIVTTAGPSHKSDKSSKNEKSSSNRELGVSVENFGKVTDFFYRGAQPKADDYSQLAGIGIKTVIDLRDDPRDYAKGMTERAGMKYINFPLSDKDYPAADTASKFLTIINDQENWPVYVHCAGGRHRTGIMTAVFRMANQGWDINRAYGEMKEYDFYTRWGHKAMKDFVFDYYRGLSNKRHEDGILPTS